MTAPASYYARENVLHLDGTRVFQNEGDRAAESAVAAILAREWNCEIHHFGMLSIIDWYAIRDERIVAVIEFKARSHSSTKYSTVFLNVRKWLALQMLSIGIGAPAFYVVQFTDALGWVRVGEIDARRVRMGGCARRVKSDSDIEPVIDVPVNLFRKIEREAA